MRHKWFKIEQSAHEVCTRCGLVKNRRRHRNFHWTEYKKTDGKWFTTDKTPLCEQSQAQQVTKKARGLTRGLARRSQMVKGKSNIEKFWKGAMEGIGNVKVTVVEVKPLGPNAAREIGTITARTKGQSPQDVTGKYVVVWEKVGNEWKNTSDIWNMDK